MEIDSDLLIRVAAFVIGFWNAGHYFVAANQLRKAAHWEKVILFPALVAGHIGMCLAAVLYGSGMVTLVGAALWALISLKDRVVWGAGAYMSDVLDRRQRMREQERQAFNRYRADLMTPWESVSDLVTPSGWEEISESEKRAKERA